ncbi:hypothetical protein HZU77_004575 [Neisseriaceae bacterium TC5R-5]|nr:hypothetical protein [Neisseriaceae bacterium TC5R-5]
MSIEKFLDEYAAQFSALNVNGLTHFLTTPFMTMMDGELSSWDSLDDLSGTLFEALFGWYRSQGFSSASHRLIQVLPLGLNAATVIVEWTVYRDGQVPWLYRNGYHLKRDSDTTDWKAYGLILFD